MYPVPPSPVKTSPKTIVQDKEQGLPANHRTQNQVISEEIHVGVFPEIELSIIDRNKRVLVQDLF